MDRVGLALVFAATTVLNACADSQAQTANRPIKKGGDDRTGDYASAPEGWWKDAPNHDDVYTWGQASGVVADGPNRILVGFTGDRARPGQEAPTLSRNLVVGFNANGDIIENWTQWDTLIGFPHQLYISPYDPERHIWIVDRGGGEYDAHEQILKFTNDGKQLVLRLRDPQPRQSDEEVLANQPPGPLDYGQAAVLAFFPNGDFLVGDGYQNGRIIRYDAQGEFLYDFGRPGSGEPGLFNLVHGVAIDADYRIFVSDRDNDRIQIFTENGEFIEEWPDIKGPTGIYIDENERVWVMSTTLNQISQYSIDGQLQYDFGAYCCTRGGFLGGFSRPHQMNIDDQGNLYVANYDGGFITKYSPKPDADPAHIVGQPLLLEERATN
jgi:DNA-binding beta-propeller fold protein YncE